MLQNSIWLTLLSCPTDINECIRPNVCQDDQECKNTRGSFTCTTICTSGFERASNGSCVGKSLSNLILKLRSHPLKLSLYSLRMQMNMIQILISQGYFHSECFLGTQRKSTDVNYPLPICDIEIRIAFAFSGSMNRA